MEGYHFKKALTHHRIKNMNPNPFASMKCVDLTHPLHENIPTWGGGCGFSCAIKMDYDQGLRAQSLRLHAGVGTHMDAPAHFMKGGQDISEIPLSSLMLQMHILHKKCKTADDMLTPEDIFEYEKTYGRIESGSFVAFDSGWARYWKDPKKYRNEDADGVMHFPTIAPKACEILLNRGIKGMGIDTLSPDKEPKKSTKYSVEEDPESRRSGVGNDEEHNEDKGDKGDITANSGIFPVHHMMLGSGGYILENLANLHCLMDRAWGMFLPLPIIGGTESPVRALAFF